MDNQYEKDLKTVKNVTLIFAIIFAGLGVLLLLFPFEIYDFLGYLIGAAAIVFGAYLLILYFMKKRAASILAVDLFAGILMVAFGTICLVMHTKVTGYTSLIFGLLMVAGSIIKFQNAIDLFRIGMIHWWAVLVLGGISVILGVLLLSRPSLLKDTERFLLASGIFLLYDSLSDFTSVILFSMQWRRVRKEPSLMPESEQTANAGTASSSGHVDSMENSWRNMQEESETSESQEEKDGRDEFQKESAEPSDSKTDPDVKQEDLNQKLSDADKDFKEMQ